MKKINYFKNLVGLVCLGLLMSACTTTPNRAPVVERVPVASIPEANVVIPVAKPVLKSAENAKGNYIVKRGDTLYRIALDHGQSYSDLVAWNGLKNPNDIKVDQVLRVAPPDAVLNAAQGVQTTAVTPGTVDVKPLSGPVSSLNKNGPKGEKRSYSESVLVELQKPDNTAMSALAKNDAPNPVVTIKPVEKSTEKATDKVVVDNETVDWMWPVDGKVLAGFDDAKNKGLDISGKMGQDVLAAGAGKVMYAGSGIRGYGNLVIIKHSSSLLSAYAHNKSILVKEGQAIAKGQKIAEMGNSDSDSVNLHFEIRLQGKPVDPMRYLPAR
ncbi:peptidoglycan DD-metalloendopeptidase family protein [Undibacterium sp. SXout11W]|uniref:peptidoglycan DD-metalloendopeptidase family protein n=1 Tax=Undibacterium sp. SXout11W TaxID=3413050 RepID=UPI003BF0820E